MPWQWLRWTINFSRMKATTRRCSITKWRARIWWTILHQVTSTSTFCKTITIKLWLKNWRFKIKATFNIRDQLSKTWARLIRPFQLVKIWRIFTRELWWQKWIGVIVALEACQPRRWTEIYKCDKTQWDSKKLSSCAKKLNSSKTRCGLQCYRTRVSSRKTKNCNMRAISDKTKSRIYKKRS